MDVDLAQKAVSAALEANWKEAVTLNQQILKEVSDDVEALNRLSRAYAELGNIKKARSLAEKVLRLDPFNSIAAKALSKLKGFKKSSPPISNLTEADAFLEDAGKTRMLSLIHLGDTKIINKLAAGEEVSLIARSHRVSVETSLGKYIGRLPDDLSARLKKLISMGNEYRVLIKSTEPTEVKIFIREVVRAPKLAETPSFPPEKIDYVSFTPPELVHKKDLINTPLEED